MWKKREYIKKKLTFILELKMNVEGAITMIKARGVKGQSLFQGLYLRHCFFILVYIAIYVSFFTPNFQLHAYFLFQFFGFESFIKFSNFFSQVKFLKFHNILLPLCKNLSYKKMLIAY